MRVIYCPKDAQDYTYYPVKAGTAHNIGNAGSNENTWQVS